MLIRAPIRRNRAFTLTELLMVILIIAITAAVVIPNIINTNDIQVVSAVRMLAADIQYAQDTAITTQLPVTITFDTNNESYQLSNASGLLKHPIKKGDDFKIELKKTQGLGNVNIVSANFGGTNAVTFDYVGSPSAVTVSSGTHNVVMQAGSNVYYLDVAPATGKVTVKVGP